MHANRRAHPSIVREVLSTQKTPRLSEARTRVRRRRTQRRAPPRMASPRCQPIRAFRRARVQGRAAPQAGGRIYAPLHPAPRASRRGSPHRLGARLRA